MTAQTPNRGARRTRKRNKRDHDRSIRELALRTAATLADEDGTVSGFAVIMPDGSVTYLDAETLRRGGRA